MESIKDLVNVATGAMDTLSLSSVETEANNIISGNEVGGEIITKVADDASNLLGPNSFATTAQPENKDVVQATTTVNTTNLTQHPSAPTIPFTPDFRNVDNFHSMAYDITTGDKNPSKLIRLDTASWQTSYSRQYKITTVELPKSFWDDTRKPAYGQAKYFAAVRCGFLVSSQKDLGNSTVVILYCLE